MIHYRLYFYQGRPYIAVIEAISVTYEGAVVATLTIEDLEGTADTPSPTPEAGSSKTTASPGKGHGSDGDR